MKKAKVYKPPHTISRADYLHDGSDSVFRETIYSLVLSTQRLLACRDAFGKDMGRTPSQFAVLMGVAYSQGSEGVTIKALADHVSLAPTHVTTDVGRLERAGLLEKRPSQADKRSVLVSLTPAGEAEIAKVAPLVRTVNDILFRGISSRDLNSTRKVARALIENSEYAWAELRLRAMREG